MKGTVNQFHYDNEVLIKERLHYYDYILFPTEPSPPFNDPYIDDGIYEPEIWEKELTRINGKEYVKAIHFKMGEGKIGGGSWDRNIFTIRFNEPVEHTNYGLKSALTDLYRINDSPEVQKKIELSLECMFKYTLYGYSGTFKVYLDSGTRQDTKFVLSSLVFNNIYDFKIYCNFTFAGRWFSGAPEEDIELVVNTSTCLFTYYGITAPQL